MKKGKKKPLLSGERALIRELLLAYADSVYDPRKKTAWFRIRRTIGKV